MHYIAFDSHKRYTLALVETADGVKVSEDRIDHEYGAIARYLADFDRGSNVALETIGSWYWIADEIEEAGMHPRLTHAHKAKMMMAMVNKSDRLDCRGLNKLQRSGTLPTVWIPPASVRDARELPRTRMDFVRKRTQLKNRVHATLSKYGIRIDEVSDVFGKRGRQLLESKMPLLPEHARFTLDQMLNGLDFVHEQLNALEERMHQVFDLQDEIQLLMSLPGVGFILAVVIWTEIGEVKRFSVAEKLASYSGTTPRIHQSGAKRHYGRVRADVNRYLKWAYAEAANVICMHRTRHAQRHVSQLYERIRDRKSHQTAIGAVSRHLAEATWWILTKGQKYKEPKRHEKMISSKKG